MLKTPVLIAAALSLLATAAFAQPAHEAAKIADFGRRMFATKSPDNAVACFVRTYDAAHLARHPKQTVSAMKMLISGEQAEGDTSLSYSYKLGVKLRNRTGDFVSNYDCGQARVSEVKREGVQVSCHDGCEDGGVLISLAPDSKAIIVKLDSVAVWPADKPEDQNAVFELKGGTDDKVFRLDRVDMENCKSLIKEGDEVAAVQPE